MLKAKFTDCLQEYETIGIIDEPKAVKRELNRLRQTEMQLRAEKNQLRLRLNAVIKERNNYRLQLNLYEKIIIALQTNKIYSYINIYCVN